MAKIRIIIPGMYTTIQDLGRFGYQKFGMPVSGAMDTYSLKLANKLLGNSEGEACLECTASGPTIEFQSKTFISICGADMEAHINNRPVSMYKTLQVNKGDILSCMGLKNGFRTYIAFAGGIDVPLVMGSKSTYLRGKIGGIMGRQLKSGDEIQLGIARSKVEFSEAEKTEIPVYNDTFTARVIPGPEANHFTVKGLTSFLYSEYTLSSQCDRMGFRLNGPKIEHKLSAEIISSGIAFGTIQVPAHGEPIIMMADRQTTGGYARIANVISADLPYLAQLKPGDKIRFTEVKLSNISTF